eukprot:UN05050
MNPKMWILGNLRPCGFLIALWIYTAFVFEWDKVQNYFIPGKLDGYEQSQSHRRLEGGGKKNKGKPITTTELPWKILSIPCERINRVNCFNKANGLCSAQECSSLKYPITNLTLNSNTCCKDINLELLNFINDMYT